MGLPERVLQESCRQGFESKQKGKAPVSEQSQDTPHPSVLSTVQEQRTSSRCRKPKPRRPAFRLLSGSQHVIVCPACSAVLWGWKEKKANQ